jgi:hypothetical protein
MLKIKDSVDLKELEKFGFKFYEKANKKCWGIEYYEWASYLKVCQKTRIIDMSDEYCYDGVDFMDILFDLIKADLVEKV